MSGTDTHSRRAPPPTDRAREAPWRPTREQLDAARGRTIPDVLADQLCVVFVGINPGLYSGAVGHHFARPGNRFWKALHGSGFTEREWSPYDDQDLPTVGLGITNLVDRTTASAAELTADELRTGRGARGEDRPVPTGYRRDPGHHGVQDGL
jgi:double-stranded uracil-DNA glycosylase